MQQLFCYNFSDYSPYNDDYNDDEESDEESISIETVPNGFKLCMDVPSQLVKFICGKKMENKINIERETKTKIELPEHGAECPVGKCMILLDLRRVNPFPPRGSQLTSKIVWRQTE